MREDNSSLVLSPGERITSRNFSPLLSVLCQEAPVDLSIRLMLMLMLMLLLMLLLLMLL